MFNIKFGARAIGARATSPYGSGSGPVKMMHLLATLVPAQQHCLFVWVTVQIGENLYPKIGRFQNPE
jgi:hypothetical protein